MSRKKTPDILDEMLQGKEPGKKRSPLTSSEMKVTPLRLSIAWRDRLRSHFKERGQDLSNGLRGIIADYMDREGLK